MKFFIPILLVITLNITSVYAQGCSDAGFCTMGAMRPNQAYSKKLSLTLRSIEVSQYFGMTSFYLTILAYNIDANIGISNRLTAQVKLPYQFVFGKLANTNGIGDVSISATYNLVAKEDYQINISVGAKIPTNDANRTAKVKDTLGVEKDLPLPMYYQTSLGSYDIIAGISVLTRDWLFAAGYQQALTQNGNQFLWGPWNSTSLAKNAGNYPKSKNLLRGTDVMFRVEKNFRFSNWNAYIGLLNIFRITKDEFEDVDGKRTTVRTENYVFGNNIGTGNFAISLLAGAGYRFNTKSAVKIMFGYQLVGRTAYEIKGANPNFEMNRNPDGLSRLLVATLGYEYRF